VKFFEVWADWPPELAVAVAVPDCPGLDCIGTVVDQPPLFTWVALFPLPPPVN
jgi:hypothetical protein